uniref:glucomannan 4-beta-mannosyltransferase n=1 Tax=Oryza barthii TaxID=65489 RepID=A0A0D3H7A9_9ORYZ
MVGKAQAELPPGFRAPPARQIAHPKQLARSPHGIAPRGNRAAILAAPAVLPPSQLARLWAWLRVPAALRTWRVPFLSAGFRRRRRSSSPARVPEDRGHGEARREEGEPQGQEPPAAEEVQWHGDEAEAIRVLLQQAAPMLVDDHNKKILFYGSTLQKAICGDPPCGAVEAAGRIGEELIRACKELDITEISSYDRNGFARGEKMMAFEVPDLVELECIDWARKEINIKYEIRDNRKGYKAGALKKGMEHIYTQQCDFVAIFDADFQPESDFLLKIIPFLVHNPKIGLVQTRWEFVNYDVCLMTRIQKMSLDYHFKVEQESGSSMHSFFGFNGTAAVWRVSATINEAGGWKDHTTVEDMDLAVRLYGQASRDGNSCMLRVNSQVPSKPTDISSIDGLVGVSVWKKLHLLYSFFFVRRVVAPILTFLFYRVVIPLSVMVPEVSIPVWGMVCIPTAITIMNAIRNPGSLHLMPFWILFENVMAMHRMRAALTGLLETMNVNQWVVTEKVGDHVKDKLEVPLLEPLKPTDCVERIYIPELVVAFYLLRQSGWRCHRGEGGAEVACGAR